MLSDLILFVVALISERHMVCVPKSKFDKVHTGKAVVASSYDSRLGTKLDMAVYFELSKIS
jgi:hypothetical protein